MSRFNLWVLSILLGIGASQISSAATLVSVNFESFTGGPFTGGNSIPVASRLSNQLLSSGVLFQSSAPYVAVVQLGSGHATSGVNGIAGASAAGTVSYNIANPITITFVDPTNAAQPATTDFVSVKIDLDSLPAPSATLYAYDLNGQQIGSDFHNDSPGQVFSISTPGIHSVKFSGVNVPDGAAGGMALDDLSFNAVKVPEPAIYWAAWIVAICIMAIRPKRVTPLVLTCVVSILLLGANQSQAAVTPVPSVTDLWDVSRGTTVKSASPSDYNPVEAALGLPYNNPGIGLDDVFFRDGLPSNYVYFINFETASAVTINHFILFGYDDRSSGNFGQRGIAGFRLFANVGGSLVQVFSGTPTIPYPVQPETGAVVFDADITPVTAKEWRAEFDRAGPTYGPRVKELDGFFVPEPGTGILALALFPLLRRRTV